MQNHVIMNPALQYIQLQVIYIALFRTVINIQNIPSFLCKLLLRHDITIKLRIH